MKLKELHIRNIASIERADIDFEHDLVDAITGDPASIFLISGDTGAGKSVILDSISMALYKKTPRIADVANVAKNEYTDAEGEQIRVAAIEQYTRLGISASDDCYSELVFEGNDARVYHARLTLGMKQGAKDKLTGKRPLKHNKPKWEIRIDQDDWTKDRVEQTILDAIGLDFQQFGRMAMLAQGQFANFLTGDKKEREAILEQLTNTQLFSAYGEAISSLWRKARDQHAQILTRYETEKPHTLSEQEVQQLMQALQLHEQQKTMLDKTIEAQEDRLHKVEIVLHNEQMQAEAKEKIGELETIIAGEEYKRKKALFTDWDATTQQRQLLSDLQKARHEEQVAAARLQQLQDLFRVLYADMLDRQQRAETAAVMLRQDKEWIEKRRKHETLFLQAGEVELKIKQLLGDSRKRDVKARLLHDEQARTAQLLKARDEAVQSVQRAAEAVNAKDLEIETLSRQREALHPKAINDEKSRKEREKRDAEDIRKAFDEWQTSINETDALREEIAKEDTMLATLKAESEKAEQVFLDRRAASEKADKLLTTMQMSVNETLVNLRHRLQEEHTATCPLCGQHIDHTLLDDDFHGMLTPLEEEQKRAARDYRQATRWRDEARDAYKNLDGAHQHKNKQLQTAQQKTAKARETLVAKTTQAGLDIGRPLIPQLEKLLATLSADIDRLQAAQQQAETLQQNINKLLQAKRPLEARKSEAETTRTNAENAVIANREAIGMLDREHRELTDSCASAEADIGTLLHDYCQDWQADTDALRNQLRTEAKEYVEHQRKVSDDSAQLDRDVTLNAALCQFSQRILQASPALAVEAVAKAHSSHDINKEWTGLLASVTSLVSKIKDCQTVTDTTSRALAAYYQTSGKTEESLLALMDHEQEVAAARQLVTQTDALLKSRQDAVNDAQRQIDAAFAKLGVGDRSLLPDRQQLLQEKMSAGNQRDDLLAAMAQCKARLDTHQANIQRLRQIESQLNDAKTRLARWDRLNSIFGGTRFRTLVQTYIMRPLLNNANIYLEQITDRYHLTCSQANEQLSILVHDRYNKNQVRSVTVLSGGERFMLSLALSLALSSLNRPDMNVNILFIDEGFGTLDENSLNSIMSTLEKLQDIAGQTNRRVGIISHREELCERIPVKVKVVKKGEGRSLIAVSNQ